MKPMQTLAYIKLRLINRHQKPFNFRCARQICHVCFVFVFFLTAGPAVALESGLPTAGEIVEKANHVALYQGLSMKGQVHLKIIDKQGRIRQRTLNILRKDDSGEKTTLAIPSADSSAGI